MDNLKNKKIYKTMKNTYYESVNETLFYNKHISGLDVYIIPKPGCPQVFGAFAVQYGSNDREFIPYGKDKSIVVPDGTAHLLEHCIFQQENISFFHDYASIGSTPGAYINCTSTVYLFNSRGNVKDKIDILFQNIQHPYFDDKKIEEEKGIIEREIRNYEYNPSRRVYLNLLDCMYVRYPVKKDFLGTIESISQINKDLLYECYKTFYQLSNAMLLIVGDVDPQSITDIVNSSIKNQIYDGKSSPKRIYPHEPAALNKKFTEQWLHVSEPLFAIGFKDNDIGYKGRDLLKKEVITYIILEELFGIDSELYRDMYYKGLIDNSFSSNFMGEEDYGYSVVRGKSRDPEKVYNTIKNYIKEKGFNAFDEKKWEKTKNRLADKLLESFNSVSFLISNFVSYYMRDINLLQYIDVIKEIEYKEVLDRFKRHISTDFMAVSIINPM